MADLEKVAAKRKKKDTSLYKNSTKTSKKSSTKTKKVTKVLKKQVKSFGLGALLILALAIIVGAVGGFLCVSTLCRNDTFEMNNYATFPLADVYIGADEEVEEYTEFGAKCIAFGTDISDQVNVKYLYRKDITFEPVQIDSIDTSQSGIYYAVYTCNHFKYKTVTLIRNIYVTAEGLDG